MINFLKQHLIGKRLIKSNGDASPRIKDIKMNQIVVPDSPENDWWGHTYYEATVYFEGDSWGTLKEIPFKDCLSYQIEGETTF